MVAGPLAVGQALGHAETVYRAVALAHLQFALKAGDRQSDAHYALELRLNVTVRRIRNGPGFCAVFLVERSQPRNDIEQPALLLEGRLVELVPGAPLDIPLFWQVNRLAADPLSALTQAVVAAARGELAAA